LVATKGSALTYTGQDYLYIGKQGAHTGEYFLGLMNEVLVYDAALVLADIQALAATGPNGGPLPPDPYAVSYSAASTSNIIGYWRNDGNTNWIDRSSNSNDMTAVGALDARILIQVPVAMVRDFHFYAKTLGHSAAMILLTIPLSGTTLLPKLEGWEVLRRGFSPRRISGCIFIGKVITLIIVYIWGIMPLLLTSGFLVRIIVLVTNIFIGEAWANQLTPILLIGGIV
jgi:hypothetical protein